MKSVQKTKFAIKVLKFEDFKQSLLQQWLKSREIWL